MKESEIEKIFTTVRKEVEQSGNEQDINYFRYHEKRFMHMAKSISKTLPTDSKILEIGSHYMHSSIILRKMGYQVVASDVNAFMSQDLVIKRAETYHIDIIEENNLESLESQADVSDQYDALLFTEIFEHITFNPINFWKNIYRILKSKSCIYISTPNGLALAAIVRELLNIISLRGIGIGVGSVFGNVTYGHHWKVYSSYEIKKYFRFLSDDFNVNIKRYSYSKLNFSSPQVALWTLLEWLGNLTYFFSTDLEAIVHLDKTGDWKLEPPSY